MRNSTVTACILCLLLFSACTTLYEFPIEVYQPSKVNLAPNIKNIALVSRNLKYRTDTLQHYYSRNSKLTKDIRKLNMDSIAVKACFDSLSAKLSQQQQYDKITVLPVNTYKQQSVKTITAPSKAQVEQIGSTTGADAIILLDMFSGFYSVYPVTDDNEQVAQVVTASIWTIYDPASYRILSHQSIIDTLYWDGKDENDSYSATRIPNKKAAMEIAAGMTGAKYSKNLVPHWTPVKRQLLSCNHLDFKIALGLAKKSKWEQATAIWQKYTNSPSRRYQLQALYNLAVAREMEGKIEEADQLLSEASVVNSFAPCAKEKKSIIDYSLTLARRKGDLKRINAMGYEE